MIILAGIFNSNPFSQLRTKSLSLNFWSIKCKWFLSLSKDENKKKIPSEIAPPRNGVGRLCTFFFFLVVEKKTTLNIFCQRSVRTTPYAYLAEKKLCILWFGIMYFWHVDKTYQFLAKKKNLKNNEILTKTCMSIEKLNSMKKIFMLR